MNEPRLSSSNRSMEYLLYSLDNVADIIRDKVYADENDKVGGVYDAAKKVIEYITTIAAQPPVEPYAWVVPGDDQSRPSGSIDAMAWREGEFTKPLYAQPQAAPAWEDLTAIIRPMIESVCSDGNSDAARLAKDIADRIIASCSLTRPKEK